jgi:hypothetical protein
MNDAFDRLFAYHEIELHRGVHRWMSEPARVLQTSSGNRLQILSPGRYNPHGGPDFEEAAVLLGGTVLSGAIEFDKCRSLWSEHHHDQNPAYHRVILHAVLIDDDPARTAPEVVVIPADELLPLLEKAEESSDTVSFDELQSYALLRLLRQSSEHTEYYRGRSVREGFVLSVRAFLQRYASKRRRPRYTSEQFDRLVGCAAQSPQAAFLERIVAGVPDSVPQQLSALCHQPIASEGQRLRGEIVTNCVVPSACVLASEQLRIGVFTWYWSARALNRYALLAREFPRIPQSYVWQQQGMLEMLRYRNMPVALGEVFRQYSTLLALDFYRAAHEPPLLEDER